MLETEQLRYLAQAMRQASGPAIAEMHPYRVSLTTETRMRILGIRFVQYLELLNEKNREEATAWIKAYTNNTTYMFRGDFYRTLAQECAPKLARLDRPIRAHSAGCSHGCELLTIACICDAHLPRPDHIFIGTDIDPEQIWMARWGRLSAYDVEFAPKEWLEKNGDWLDPDQYWYAKRSFMRRFRFLRRSVTARPPLPQFDVVAYNNVYYHLGAAGQRRAADRILSSVAPGGFLLTDIAVEGAHPQLTFTEIGENIYERTA